MKGKKRKRFFFTLKMPADCLYVPHAVRGNTRKK
jgi:hypothetical protein